MPSWPSKDAELALRGRGEAGVGTNSAGSAVRDGSQRGTFGKVDPDLFDPGLALREVEPPLSQEQVDLISTDGGDDDDEDPVVVARD